MNATLERIGRAALDLLYPPRCVLCSRGGSFLCETCREGLPRADGLRCSGCWLPLRQGEACARCREQPLALSGLRSVFRYEGDVRRLVHAFKFGGQSCLAEPLAATMERQLRGWLGAVDVIVPVPLSSARRRQRGFNQAALLAARLGRALDLPGSDALERRGGSQPQARSASAAERWRNVAGAFAVRRAAVVAGRRVLLIDDVATTGATLDECARVLLAAGALEVAALTLARED